MLPSLPCHESITGNTKDDRFIFPESDTNFLNDLVVREDSKITIVLELYNSLNILLSRNELSFKSKSQLKFVTEILGNGLIPPLNKFHKKNERKVHKGILKLYEYILFGSVDITQGTEKKVLVKREDPKRIISMENESDQQIFREILSHMTFIFDKKNFAQNLGELFRTLSDIPALKVPDSKQEEDIRKLSLYVLSLYNRFIEKYFKLFTTATWEFILKLLMGITNYMLEGQITNNDTLMSNLFNQLLISLFNAWIQSGIKEAKLWAVFSDYAKKWVHRETVFKYWRAIIQSLTAKIWWTQEA